MNQLDPTLRKYTTFENWSLISDRKLLIYRKNIINYRSHLMIKPIHSCFALNLKNLSKDFWTCERYNLSNK